jgi:hypothetical protein
MLKAGHGMGLFMSQAVGRQNLMENKSTTPDLAFIIKLNSHVTFENLKKWFSEEWQDLGIQWQRGCALGETEDNLVEIEHGYEDAANRDTRYYMVTVIPKQDSVPTKKQIEDQIDFARRLMSKLSQKGCEPEFDSPTLEQYL